MKSKIVHVGKDAFSKEPILILFGEDATDAIRDVSLLQKFEEDIHDFQLQIGDHIYFGDQVYTITHIGKSVSANLMSLGHVTFVFKPFDPQNIIETSIYLSPHNLPEVAAGMTITYQSSL